MASILTNGERPVSAVQLAGPILVETGRGEVEGNAGDYLVVTTAGRQVVMSEKEYRTATGAPDQGAVSPPPTGSVTPKTKPKRDVLGSIFKTREPVRQKTWKATGRFPGFAFFGKKPAPETREPLAITSARESETSARDPEPPGVSMMPGPHTEAELEREVSRVYGPGPNNYGRDPEPPADVSIPINLSQIDTSEESSSGTSSPVDIPENVSSPVDVQPDPDGVKREELPPSSDQIDLKCAELAEEMSGADTYRGPSLTATDGINLPTIGPGTSRGDLPPPTPRPMYNPRVDPANLVLPKQKPGVFQKFMRPGAEPEKRPVAKKKPFALAFGKKAKEPEPEPVKDRWPTVQPEWI